MADVLIVCVDSTRGWTASAEELQASMQRAGADARIAHTGTPPTVRTFALTDLVQARLARRAAQRGIAEHDPAAIVYCGITSALLWPRPGAIYLDSLALENRPGRHGVWQRPVERRRVAQAPLILMHSQRSLDPLTGPHAPTVVVAPPVDPSPSPVAPPGEREVEVVAYAGDPDKRRLGMLLDAWEQVRRSDERMVVTGLDGFSPPPGVESTGRVDREEFLGLLRRARVFAAAPRREDYGIAALEALAAGCQLVTTPSPGPYPALDIARAADPRLVATDLAPAIRIALDDPLRDYALRVAPLLEPFTTAAIDRAVAGVVLPRLLSGWRRPSETRA